MQNFDDQSLTTKQVAQMLDLPLSVVRSLARSKVLPARKVNRCWCFDRSDVEKFKVQQNLAAGNRPLATDTGIVQVSIALTGAAAAIMALVPRAVGANPLFLRAGIFYVSIAVSFFCLYASLWLLGQYAEDTQRLVVERWADSEIGIGHICALLFTPSMGPYWVLAISLIMLSVGLGLVGGTAAFG